MRLHHLKQIADGLAAGDPARMTAKAVIVTEVDRLHWRIWNGEAKDARKSIVSARSRIISEVSGTTGDRSRRRESFGPRYGY